MNPPSQQLIKDTAALQQKKFRDSGNLILVEGRHPIEEAWRAGLRLKHWFALDNATSRHLPKVDIHPAAYGVDEKQMAKMASTTSPPPCLAVFEAPAVKQSLNGELLLVLDDIQDPGNLGTLIRSAIAFGVEAIVLTTESVEPWNPKVIRASAGLVFAIPVVVLPQAALAQQLADHQYKLFATTGRSGSLSYRHADYSCKCAIVLGNEGRGVSDALLNHPQAQALTVPMNERVESLNVGISGSIILAEVAAQRKR